jgi:hypothetical protein
MPSQFIKYNKKILQADKRISQSDCSTQIKLNYDIL